jgi:hypothetical protein
LPRECPCSAAACQLSGLVSYCLRNFAMNTNDWLSRRLWSARSFPVASHWTGPSYSMWSSSVDLLICHSSSPRSDGRMDCLWLFCVSW